MQNFKITNYNKQITNKTQLIKKHKRFLVRHFLGLCM